MARRGIDVAPTPRVQKLKKAEQGSDASVGTLEKSVQSKLEPAPIKKRREKNEELAQSLDASKDAVISEQNVELETEKAVRMIQNPESEEVAKLPEEMKEAVNFAAEVVQGLEHVPTERRQLVLMKWMERSKQKKWDKRNATSLQRLAALVKESKAISKEFSQGKQRLPKGVSEVFHKKGIGEAGENVGYVTAAGIRISNIALEFGVSATAFLGVLKAAGFAVATGSPLHFVALGFAAALTGYVESAKGHSIRAFAEKRPLSLGVIGASTLALSLPAANAVTFLGSFSNSDLAADTVAQMTRAINSIKTDLEKVRVKEDENVSPLEAKVAEIDEFFKGMMRLEYEAKSEKGKGGGTKWGPGPKLAVKQGIAGVHVYDVPDTILKRPDVMETVRAARDRINEKLRAYGAEFELKEGESIPEAFQRYLSAFGASSSQEFAELEGHMDGARRIAGEYEDMIELGTELERNAEPLMAKWNAATGTPTEGEPELKREKGEIGKILLALTERYEREVGAPSKVLFKAVSEEMNLLGDPMPIEIDVPEFHPSTSSLDSVPVPKGRGFDDPELYRSIMVEKFGEKGIWVLLFSLYAFSSIGWTLQQARRLVKKQGPIIEAKYKELAGGKEEIGIELAYAEKTAERFAGQLGAADGFLKSEGAQALLPFGADLTWFELSPLEIMVAWRESAARENKELRTESSKNILKNILEPIIEGLKESVRLVPQSAEARALNQYIALLESDGQRTVAIEKSALPGFSELIGKSVAIAKLAKSGLAPTELGKRKLEMVRDFQASLLKMSFDHIAFRTRISQTTIELLKTAYDTLRKKGEFKDLDVAGLTELPRDISFDLLSEADLPEDLTSVLLRGSALRSVTIGTLERRMQAEQEKLRMLRDRLQKLVDEMQTLAEQPGAADPSFLERAAAARGELELAERAFSEHKEKNLARAGSRTAIENLLIKDVRVTTRKAMREKEEASEPSFDAREQMKAIQASLKEGIAAPLPGYEHAVRLERRVRSKDSVADYLAVVVRINRKDSGAGYGSTLASYEFPLQKVLGAGVEPAKSGATFKSWLENRAAHMQLAQRYDATRRMLDEAIASVTSAASVRGGGFPSVSFSERNTEARLGEFYAEYLPARTKNLALLELKREFSNNAETFDSRSVMKKIDDEEFKRMAARLESIGLETKKALQYQYDFGAQLSRVANIARKAAALRGVKITFRPFDPMHIGTDQAETFIIEDTGLTSFMRRGNDKRRAASLEQVEAALGGSPTDFASFVKGLR